MTVTEAPERGEQQARRPWWPRLVVTVVLMVVIGVGLQLVLADPDELRAGFEDYGLLAMAVSVPVLALASWSWIPSETIAVGQGATYGFVLGTLANVAGWTFSGVIQYLFVWRGATKGDPAALLERAPAWLRRLPASHPLFLIGARQLPFGSKLVNLASPLAGVRLWRHTWCAALGVLPTAVVCGAIGAGLWKL